MTQPGETVSALAAQVADLRGKVMTTSALVDRLGLNGALSLAGQLAELSRRVDEHCGSGGPPPKVCAPNWLGLAPGEHATALADLAAWVTGFLAVNFPHATPLPCWASHPAAVWELSTLRAEHERIYGRKHPELSGALTWYERWLPGVTERVSAALKDAGCTKAACALARRASQL